MDVDKMFKLPSLPASAGMKRKMPDAPTPGTWGELYMSSGSVLLFELVLAIIKLGLDGLVD